jgi:phosphate transport system protein
MTRELFDRSLHHLRDQILLMGSYVAEELRLAVEAFESYDLDVARKAIALDRKVNEFRASIEDECFTLILTQQPAAGDLRLVFAAANMIVDLERMGDQAKGIAKLVPDLKPFPTLTRPPELRQMAALVTELLGEAMRGFAESDQQISSTLPARDAEVDALFAAIFTHAMFALAKSTTPQEAQAVYDFIRAARELERLGDLISNFGERSVYILTGEMPDSRSPLSGSPR